MSAFCYCDKLPETVHLNKGNTGFCLMVADVSGNGRLAPLVSFCGSSVHHGMGVVRAKLAISW